MFAVFLYGFQNGGPAGLIYGYLFCWIGTLATVASLAEMASMYGTPTSSAALLANSMNVGCHFQVGNTIGFPF